MKTYQKAIDATHPCEDSAGALELAADGLAMKLVGERHEKRDLVNLVRWLILRKPQGLLPFPVVQESRPMTDEEKQTTDAFFAKKFNL